MKNSLKACFSKHIKVGDLSAQGQESPASIDHESNSLSNLHKLCTTVAL